jgi:molybdopterin-containing oxidoreductase family membrane subunit
MTTIPATSLRTAQPPQRTLREYYRAHGIGRMTTGWWVFLVAMLAGVGLGVYAYSREATEGMIVTGMRDIGTMTGAPWGLYVALLVYFIGVSFAGITVAALIRLFHLDRLQPLARMAELLTIVSLVLGALAILIDLGQPLRGVVNLLLYARPQSPFFGTFTLVLGGYLFASVVYLYLGSRRDASLLKTVSGPLAPVHRFVAAGYSDTPAERTRHRRTSFWLALALIPLLVIAHSTLGFVFGLQIGRPGWYSALQAPAFVVLAGVSGVGLLIVLAAIVRRATDEEVRLDAAVFAWLGRLLMVMILVYLYFMVTELLTASYAGADTEEAVTTALLSGPYAWVFWSSVALLVIPLAVLAYQALTRRFSLALLVASGVAVNLAAVGKRFLIALPSQTHGTLLNYETGTYSPTWVEYSVVVGLFALGALVIGLFMKFFPIVELPEEVEPDA